MTHPHNNKKKKKSLSQESVISYLISNPNFLFENESLLIELLVPHKLKGNVHSLIERQVKVLREENARFKNAAIAHMKAESKEAKRRKGIRDSILTILDIGTLEEYGEFLFSFLTKFQSTNYFRLFIFNDNLDKKNIKYIFFVGSHSRIRFLFTEIFNRNKSLCSSLQEEQLQILFGSDTKKIKSNLLIPINYNGLDGLLALGSHKENQYGIGEDLEALEFVIKLSMFKFKSIVTQQY